MTDPRGILHRPHYGPDHDAYLQTLHSDHHHRIVRRDATPVERSLLILDGRLRADDDGPVSVRITWKGSLRCCRYFREGVELTTDTDVTTVADGDDDDD